MIASVVEMFFVHKVKFVLFSTKWEKMQSITYAFHEMEKIAWQTRR